jgi:hypothetical protein
LAKLEPSTKVKWCTNEYKLYNYYQNHKSITIKESWMFTHKEACIMPRYNLEMMPDRPGSPPHSPDSLPISIALLLKLGSYMKSGSSFVIMNESEGVGGLYR